MAWYALYCEPQREARVAEFCRSAGLEAYCPLVREARRRKKRGTANSYTLDHVEVAAFPRYAFADADDRLHDLRRDPPDKVGRIRIVGAAGSPLTIADSVMAGVKLVVDQAAPLRIGDKVRVDRGGTPIIGTVSDLSRLKKRREVTTLLSILGGERSVTVPLAEVVAVQRDGNWIAASVD